MLANSGSVVRSLPVEEHRYRLCRYLCDSPHGNSESASGPDRTARVLTRTRSGLDLHSRQIAHCPRHTAVTSVYRQTRDLFLAQRFARHASPLTTVTYTQPSDDEMSNRLRGLEC